MRIGLIGFGFMGGVHLSAIEQIEGVTLAAVSARTRPAPNHPSRGNLPQVKSSSLPTEAKWYDDWQELLRDPEIDVVDICLPTHLHKQVAISAFEMGKHVLCEKPMALTRSDCDQIMDAASKSGRIFMVGQVLRFMSPYRYAASFIDAIGHDAVTSCTMKRKTGFPQWSEWLSSEASSGGAILDLLSHDIDQVLKFFGQPLTVRAVQDGKLDTMLGTLRYQGGLEVKIEGGWYESELPFSAGFEIKSGDTALTLEKGELRRTRNGSEEIIEMPEQQEYLEQIAYFIDCCRHNAVSELCPPIESANAVSIANLLKTSREQNGKELSCEKQ